MFEWYGDPIPLQGGKQHGRSRSGFGEIQAPARRHQESAALLQRVLLGVMGHLVAPVVTDPIKILPQPSKSADFSQKSGPR